MQPHSHLLVSQIMNCLMPWTAVQTERNPLHKSPQSYAITAIRKYSKNQLNLHRMCQERGIPMRRRMVCGQITGVHTRRCTRTQTDVQEQMGRLKGWSKCFILSAASCPFPKMTGYPYYLWLSLLIITRFATKQSPFFANYGYHPSFLTNESSESSVPAVQDTLNFFQQNNKLLHESIAKAQEESKKQQDRRTKGCGSMHKRQAGYLNCTRTCVSAVWSIEFLKYLSISYSIAYLLLTWSCSWHSAWTLPTVTPGMPLDFASVSSLTLLILAWSLTTLLPVAWTWPAHLLLTRNVWPCLVSDPHSTCCPCSSPVPALLPACFSVAHQHQPAKDLPGTCATLCSGIPSYLTRESGTGL